MPTQSIIVYRNPLEQQFWEGGGADAMVPVGAGLIVFLIVVVAINAWVVDPSAYRSKIRKYSNVIIFLPAILAGLAVTKWLWL